MRMSLTRTSTVSNLIVCLARSSSYAVLDSVPSSPRGYVTPRRERVSQGVTEISTPEHFPKPFQNRPPGQFHLPWSPTRMARTSMSSIQSSMSTTGGQSEHFTVKAIMQDSIVLLRASYSMSYADLREKLRDKFLSEGIKLTDRFTVGFNPRSPVTGLDKPVGARPRSQSTSSVGSVDGQRRLRFITNDADWEQAAVNCTGKLTIHVFDRF